MLAAAAASNVQDATASPSLPSWALSSLFQRRRHIVLAGLTTSGRLPLPTWLSAKRKSIQPEWRLDGHWLWPALLSVGSRFASKLIQVAFGWARTSPTKMKSTGLSTRSEEHTSELQSL